MSDEELTALAEGKKKIAMKIDPNVNYFGLVNFRNQNRKFGIKLDDRRRHMYIVGKTGMGKTTILENMVLNDIYAGHGVGLVDPHGDFAEKILDYIPPHRINDVVYFNPADIDHPIGFNILETVRAEHKHLVAAGLMGVFKKIWVDMWSSRMEYILNNTILALLDFPGTTLLGINRMLADNEYRERVVRNLKDPVVKAFWTTEFASYNDRYKQEAVAPIQNKIGQFLSASVIRNIVAQVKSKINIREIMDTNKIFVMNLSKGRIGEDNSRLLGGMLITKIQLAAMERVDTLEKDRKDFFLYVDEFQNFATESFSNILSEARKYRLDLIMAHQYMEQLDEKVLAAVVGNVGTMVTFRVGSTDAAILAKEFVPTFVEEDLVNLPKYNIYLKLMIDGVASRPFSALTLPPLAESTGSVEKVIRVSRERYAMDKTEIETNIAQWSGFMVMEEDAAGEMEVDEEEAMFTPPPKKQNFGGGSPRSGGGSSRSGGEGFKKEQKDFSRDKKFGDRKNFSSNAPRFGAGNKFDVGGEQKRPSPQNFSKPQFEKKPPVLDFSSAKPVEAVDVGQKGISLSSLSPREPKEEKEKPALQSEKVHFSTTPQAVSPIAPKNFPPKHLRPGEIADIEE